MIHPNYQAVKTFAYFIKELKKRNRPLYYTGLFHFGTFFLLTFLSLFETREIMGLNAWYKPMKFCISVGIYAWTLAWILTYLKGKRFISIVTWGISLSMIVEISLVILQAARGTTSHFNISTPLNATIFATMGLFIAFNTLLIIWVWIRFLIENPPIGAAYLLAIRLGIFIFLVGSYVGQLMVGQMAHSVGPADGGPGLIFLNWSTEGGDLRIAHFLGLHALQLIPLYANTTHHFAPFLSNKMSVWVFGFIYMACVLGLYVQAISGNPLIG